MKVIIRYAIESTDAGWLVWRQLGERPPITAGHPFPTERSAIDEVVQQCHADRGAATRLGVELETRTAGGN